MDKEGDPKLLVWTLPTRLFHWTFGTCITLALLSGEGIISMSMEQHMWVGGVALALILFRLFWGFVASDYARFDRFSLNILQLPNLCRPIVFGGHQHRMLAIAQPVHGR
jgi:Cytochrome b